MRLLAAFDCPAHCACKSQPINVSGQHTGEETSALATANDELHAWVMRDPSSRSVARMGRVGGKCIVSLKSKAGKHTSETQLTFDAAIRTVLMIAKWEGEK